MNPDPHHEEFEGIVLVVCLLLLIAAIVMFNSGCALHKHHAAPAPLDRGMKNCTDAEDWEDRQRCSPRMVNQT